MQVQGSQFFLLQRAALSASSQLSQPCLIAHFIEKGVWERPRVGLVECADHLFVMALRILKHGLMDDLLTGRVRVTSAQESTP